MTDATVILWGRRIGAVSWDEARSVGVFQYDPAFARAGIEVAPLTMPAREAPYEFPALNRETFRGLPGMLADALPDRFGNRLIDAWLAETGRSPETFNPVDRLCYIGCGGIGALEFRPALRRRTSAKTTGSCQSGQPGEPGAGRPCGPSGAPGQRPRCRGTR